VKARHFTQSPPIVGYEGYEGYEATAEERKMPWSSTEIPLGESLYCGDICLVLITMTTFAVDTWDLCYAHKDLDRG
jgi:hypothetical protein